MARPISKGWFPSARPIHHRRSTAAIPQPCVVVSPTLVVGRSYLPDSCVSGPEFVASAAEAIALHPGAAADIAIAAADRLVLDLAGEPERLRAMLAALIEAACAARDNSVF